MTKTVGRGKYKSCSEETEAGYEKRKQDDWKSRIRTTNTEVERGEDRRIICVTRDKCTIMKNRNIDNRKKEERKKDGGKSTKWRQNKHKTREKVMGMGMLKGGKKRRT